MLAGAPSPQGPVVGPVPQSRAGNLEKFLLEAGEAHLLALGLLAEKGPRAFLACVQNGELVGVAYVGRDGTVVPAGVRSPDAARELGAAMRQAPIRTLLGERGAVGGLLAGLEAPRVPGRAERLYAVTADEMGPYVTPALRRATDAEVPQLVEAHQTYLRERDMTPPADGVATMVRARVSTGRTHVIMENGQLAFVVDVLAESKHGAHLGHIYTSPRFRRKGYAALGLGQLARSMLARLPRLTACAEDGDLAALGVVRKVGFGPAVPWRRVDLVPEVAEADIEQVAEG